MLIFRDENRIDVMQPPCEAVLRYFVLPPPSLVCIFDDHERPGFLHHPELGPNFCGFFLPLRQSGIGNGVWAPELVTHIWDKQQVEFAYDASIYLRKRTCDEVTSMVITFAHELQHFMQYGHHNQEWQLQRCIQQVAAPRLIHPRPWHFPGEHEAQLISKRVAEQLLGTEEVRRYADARIASGDDIEKWQFFLGLNPIDDFDFRQQTAQWVAKYKDELLLYYPGLIQ
jgi:hypothetical protein